MSQFRIAVVNAERCQPTKCAHECKKMCPVVAQGKACVTVSREAVAQISEELCNGCNICTKVCPFHAIQIVNLPNTLKETKLHQYGKNGFMLFRLPAPRLGQILGLMGRNGTGKTTSVKILSGEIIPNFGSGIPTWASVIRYFRGSSLQDYFRAVSTGKLSLAIKPQNIMAFTAGLGTGTVREKMDTLGFTGEHIAQYNLETLLDKDIEVLSGGELQRLIVASVCSQTATSYLFDEPSSFLDIRQRIRIAGQISKCSRPDTYVTVIEHDISMLDYVSDMVSFYYGVAAAYGIVTTAAPARDGINTFLDGYLPKENVRFRDGGIDFTERVPDTTATSGKEIVLEATDIVLGSDTPAPFKLTIEKSEMRSDEILVLLGENGCGKTTWLRTLATSIREGGSVPAVKPQHITFTGPLSSGTCEVLLRTQLGALLSDTVWCQTVLQPLGLDRLFDMRVSSLSGGEQQSLAIALTLGRTTAPVYLIDEPSANLDTEQRIAVARTIRKFATQYNKLIVVIEHDFLMAVSMADRVVTFDGEPGVHGIARAPTTVAEGLNKFLSSLGVTFRRDGTSGRPRINKPGSQKDKEQRAAGLYWMSSTDASTTN